MPEVSNILSADFFSFIKSSLPTAKQSSDTDIKRWINLALSRLNNFYINHNKGVYNVLATFDFYNSNSTLINIRDNTRWCLLTPNGFYAKKLNSCMLKSVVPNNIALPSPIAFIQDIDIVIGSSQDANTTIPTENSGVCSLVESQKLYNSLTLDDTSNTWDNVMIIDCVIDYYRNIIFPQYPDGGEDEFIDALVPDFELVSAYVNEFAYRPNTPPSYIIKQQQSREFQILYGDA